MFKRSALRLLFLLSSAALSTAGAACVLQTPALTLPTYRATESAHGVLSVNVQCGVADVQPYTLLLSAFGGQFDPASGAFSFSAVGRAGTALEMQVLAASPALGGSIAPTVYTGSQRLSFPVSVPAGQWQASGTPGINLSFDLIPYLTGNRLP